MADTINLATFDFDTSRMEQNIERLQKQLFALQTEQQRYNKQNSDLQKGINALNTQQEKLISTGQKGSAQYVDNKNKIDAMRQSQERVFLNLKDLAIQQSVVNSEYQKTTATYKSYVSAEGGILSMSELVNNAMNKEITSIAAARENNKQLLAIRNQLNPKIAEEKALIDQLNTSLDLNTAFIKENVSEMEVQKMNIGDYKNQIIEAANELNIFNGGFLGFITRAQEAGGVMPLVTNSLKAITTGIGGVTKASLAFIATPIGAIIAALGVTIGLLVNYLQSTQDGIDKVTAVTRPLQAIFSALMGVVNNLGRMISGVFENPKQAVIDFAKLIKENIVNRFMGMLELIPNIGKAIGLLFKGEFAQAGKVAFDAVAKVGTGVEGMSGKIASAAEATGKFLSDAASKGAEIDRLTKQMAKSQLEYNAAQVAFGDAVDEQQLIVKDTSKSFAERGAAAKEIVRLTEENAKKEQEILQMELKRLKIQQELKGNANLTNADKQEEIDLLKKIDEAEDRGLNARLENSRVLSGLIKEQKAAQLESIKAVQDAREKALARAIETNKLELDLYLSQIGSRAKTLDEQLKIAEDTKNKRLAIAQQEYEATQLNLQNEFALSKKSAADKKALEEDLANAKLKLQVQNNDINQDALDTQITATMDNASKELQIFIDTNQRKLDNNRFFSDQLYQQEIDRLDKVKAKQLEFEAQRYANGLITLEDYNAQVNAINTADQEERDAVALEREDAAKAKEAIDLENKRLAMTENMDYDLAFQLEDMDRKKAAEIENAEKTGADTSLIEAKYAKIKNDITEQVNANKVALASSTLGSLANIAGKESAAGKAFAVTQTLIDTYASATAAYKAMAGIPVIGPALGGIAAAAAVVSGLKSVQKITSTKQPKGYATGGIITDGRPIRRSNGDDVLITAKRGETIINERQRNFIGADMLAAAGVPGYATGGVVGASSRSIVQNAVTNSFDQALFSDMISTAVREGSEQGAFSGSKQGSKDGIVNSAENRTVQQTAAF